MAESNFSEFITYFKNRPKTKGTCCIFERNDGYSIYGEDALLINQEVLKASKLKVAQGGNETLNYVNISKINFILVLKYLLFVRQYKIEILRNTGTVRSPNWILHCKASPGNVTAVEDLILSENESYVQESRGLVAVKVTHDNQNIIVGVAFCDPVLREIKICEVIDDSDFINFQSILVQLSPQECLLPVASPGSKQSYSSSSVLSKILKTHQIAISECKKTDFQTTDMIQDLNRLLCFEGGIKFDSLKDEPEMKHALSALGSIIKYLELLSDSNNFGQFYLSVFKSDQFAKVDIQSITGLGLFSENPKDLHEKQYLFGYLNRCCTTLGERLLVQWIKQPLMDLRKLEERLDIVEVFVNDFALRNETSKLISKFPDIDAICRKIQRRNANLQDLYKIYLMLMQLPKLNTVLSKYSGPHIDVISQNFITELEERIEDFQNFTSMIESTIDLEALKNKEYIVKAEYDEELLDLWQQMKKVEKSIKSAGESVKADLNVPTIKLECCKVIGYHLRITRKDEKNLRHRKGYNVIDTKASGVRFQSSLLKDLNDQYVSLRKNYEEKQKEIVDQIIDVAASYTQPLKTLSHLISWLDVSLSFATVSVNASKPYIRPVLQEKEKCCIILNQARHPVLESAIENFIPNDIKIEKGQNTFYFVTGPNMGGKSTFIRSVALNVLLAQIGCFVPCDKAEISLVDAIYTRIGACDKPSKAVSTFMYEMVEVQTILKSATSSSLIIIDEMGRGTSTYDGFGLSWAISRHIAETILSPCLFATHFHELTALSKQVPTIGNLHVEAITSEGDIIFLYCVKPGISDESFGIHVCKLAEFPEQVIQEANEKLQLLNKAHMPVQEIFETFSNVPQGEIVMNAFKEEFGNTGSLSNIAENFESKKFPGKSHLEVLSIILNDLVGELEL